MNTLSYLESFQGHVVFSFPKVPGAFFCVNLRPCEKYWAGVRFPLGPERLSKVSVTTQRPNQALRSSAWEYFLSSTQILLPKFHSIPLPNPHPHPHPDKGEQSKDKETCLEQQCPKAEAQTPSWRYSYPGGSSRGKHLASDRLREHQFKLVFCFLTPGGQTCLRYQQGVVRESTQGSLG